MDSRRERSLDVYQLAELRVIKAMLCPLLPIPAGRTESDQGNKGDEETES